MLSYNTLTRPGYLADFEWHEGYLCTKLFQRYDLEIVSDFDIHLYLTPLHVATQTTEKSNFFFLYRQQDTHTPVAVFQCGNYEENWHSPLRAPFGSIQCDSDCTTTEINFFLDCITSYVLKQGGVKLTIQHYPIFYLEKTVDLVIESYLTYGFITVEERINHHIPVSSKTFGEVINRMERRRLARSVNNNFVSGVEIEINAKKVYDFLSLCRSKKGYGMSMNEKQLTQLLITFPKDTIVFTVKKDKEIIALSVAVRVNKRVLYNFLIDSLPEYNAYSPSVLLTQSIYNYCQNEKIEILDLGTSLDHHGSEKAGLIRFKDNIGGIRSHKVTFSKKFIPD